MSATVQPTSQVGVVAAELSGVDTTKVNRPSSQRARRRTGKIVLGVVLGIFTLLFLFLRVLPMISIFELRELVHETEGEG